MLNEEPLEAENLQCFHSSILSEWGIKISAEWSVVTPWCAEEAADLRPKIILTREGRLRARASKGQPGHSMGVVIRPLIRFSRAGWGRKNALQ